MRRLLLGSAALTVMSATAFAADLPARAPAPAPAPVYVAPIFTWTGFYAGLNAGAAFRSGSDRRSDFVFDDPAGSVAPGLIAGINNDLALVRRGGDNTGFTGGAQIGYNWQFGSMVAGIEADINYMGGNRGDRGYFIPGIAGSGLDLTVAGNGRGSNWFGTIRPRLGVAFDRTLVYATGGLAYSKGNDRRGYAVLTDPGAGDAIVAEWFGNRRSSSNWGWTLGAGIEHAFTNNWSAKLEYLYVDLDRGGNQRYISLDAAPYNNIVGVSRRNQDGLHVVRAGVNYRFGGTAAGRAVAAY